MTAEIKPVRMFAAMQNGEIRIIRHYAKDARDDTGRNWDKDPKHGWQLAKDAGYYIKAVLVFNDCGGRYVA